MVGGSSPHATHVGLVSLYLVVVTGHTTQGRHSNGKGNHTRINARLLASQQG